LFAVSVFRNDSIEIRRSSFESGIRVTDDAWFFVALPLANPLHGPNVCRVRSGVSTVD
jgi:hypothetical protein